MNSASASLQPSTELEVPTSIIDELVNRKHRKNNLVVIQLS